MHYPNTDDKKLYTIHHIDTDALAAAVKGSMQPVNSRKGKAACYDGCSEERADTGGGAVKKHLIVSSELIAEPIEANTWIAIALQQITSHRIDGNFSVYSHVCGV